MLDRETVRRLDEHELGEIRSGQITYENRCSTAVDTDCATVSSNTVSCNKPYNSGAICW